MYIKHMFRQAAGLAALIGTLALGGCGQRDDRIAALPDSSATPPDGPFGHATIIGIVRFVGATPANPPIDMGAAPRCRAIYHSTPRQLSAVVNPNGTLANVFVYVKRGLPTHSRYTPAADSLLVTPRGCQYHPRVFGMMVGQTLAFRNDDVVAHHLEAAGLKTRPFTIPHPAGRRHHHAFRKAEVMVPLECDTHRWMRAYVGILPHPFFATTNRSGRFTIPRLPPGTYTLEAWHEGYGRRTTTVTVSDSTTRYVTFTYTPTPPDIS